MRFIETSISLEAIIYVIPLIFSPHFNKLDATQQILLTETDKKFISLQKPLVLIGSKHAAYVCWVLLKRLHRGKNQFLTGNPPKLVV